MGQPDFLSTIYTQLPKFLKWMIFAIVFVFATITLIVGGKFIYKDCCTTDHYKFLWWETNLDQKMADSSKIVKKRQSQFSLADTSRITPIVQLKDKKIPFFTPSTSNVQQNINGKNEAYTNNGVNNGIMGEKGHIVYGDNNGVNGDVNINKDFLLTDADLTEIFYEIEKLRVDSATYKGVTISQLPYCDAPKVAEQIHDFLTKRGYRVGFGQVIPASSNIIKGFVILAQRGGGITVDIGKLRQ
ncbi:hypothetical protein EOD41_10790 [Mucilaginibacter limnophilus]|uniref:Uncharacterized protein n=1 Tax=Mucilaginibacter limnophilus TaxID=1932778 RepID=A0A3S2ULF1_9SPHI|nr:hypothetical protein [Mucilaginibacter limnophilus]RVU01092.1 hypothetical protein EOD41_10790 [Mucilaginibacter limnophilus]